MSVLEFITVTTGSTTMNARSQVPDELVGQIKQAMQTGKMFRVPGGWGCEATASTGAWAFSLYRDGMPVTTCIVCWDKTKSDTAWEVATLTVPDNVVLHRPRGVPWLTAKIEVSAFTAIPDAMSLVSLAKTEMAIAWAIIEMQAGP